MVIKNITRGTILADKAIIADSFFSRLKGLLGRAKLEQGEALVIPGCNCIHTFFMRFAIDVLFLDAGGKVVGKVEDMQPFRVSAISFRANRVIEFSSKALQNVAIQIGDIVNIEP